MTDLDAAITQVRPEPAAYVLAGNSEPLYLYKGSCRNLQKRLRDHRAGRVSRTKNLRPLMLVHCEYCDSYTVARQRENWLKSGSGRDFIRTILEPSG